MNIFDPVCKDFELKIAIACGVFTLISGLSIWTHTHTLIIYASHDKPPFASIIARLLENTRPEGSMAT